MADIGLHNKLPQVSVVMASYNHAQFVGDAIESVLQQSFQDFEFIITDDGSTDGTPDVIRRFIDSRIDLEVFTTNQGACEATNHCIDRARGNYVAVINSDDFFLPGKLARQVAILDAEPKLAAVFGLPHFVDEAGAQLRSQDNHFANVFSAAPADRFAWLRHFFLRGNALCHPTVMVRRRIYSELGTYNVALRQLPDFDMWIRICAQYPIRVLPEPMTAFRVLDGLRNTSARTPETTRRTLWEHSRVLRRYWTIDETTLQRAFTSDITPEIAVRRLPMRVQLALLAATKRDLPLQIYALETMEEAIAAGVPGLGPRDLHKLSGELDPFRLHEIATFGGALRATSLWRATAPLRTLVRRMGAFRNSVRALL
jgi:glycosyltransferase involved in cell wall biosynthesis